MKFLKNLKESASYYLMRQGPVNKEWDETLSRCMDKYEVKYVDRYNARFNNGVTVWIADRFYAFGTPSFPHSVNVFPKLKTSKRLWELVKDRVPLEKTMKEKLSEIKYYDNHDR